MTKEQIKNKNILNLEIKIKEHKKEMSFYFKRTKSEDSKLWYQGYIRACEELLLESKLLKIRTRLYE